VTYLESSASWKYYIDFILVPITIIAVSIVYCNSWLWVLGSLFGIIAWTFAEYWIHRSILHRWFYEGNHGEHHNRPLEYVTFPILYIPVLFGVLFLILPSWFFTGFIAGYLWFIVMHDFLHHHDLTNTPRWMQKFSIWHNRHHKFTHCNYGVTNPFWDAVFLTSK
jgi:dihydroceramide fatty acyl 2-hydroxylase